MSLAATFKLTQRLAMSVMLALLQGSQNSAFSSIEIRVRAARFMERSETREGAGNVCTSTRADRNN
ncbi:hypothetical protein ACVIW2_003544 [Bradyrhizobium huanghuaihaiense]